MFNKRKVHLHFLGLTRTREPDHTPPHNGVCFPMPNGKPWLAVRVLVVMRAQEPALFVVVVVACWEGCGVVGSGVGACVRGEGCVGGWGWGERAHRCACEGSHMRAHSQKQIQLTHRRRCHILLKVNNFKSEKTYSHNGGGATQCSK